MFEPVALAAVSVKERSSDNAFSWFSRTTAVT